MPVSSVPYPAGPLDGVAWLPDGRIVFGLETLQENGVRLGTHLWSIRPDGSAAGPLTTDPEVACTGAETLAPLVLASGELSYQLRCTPGTKGASTYRTGLSVIDAKDRPRTLMPLTDLPFVPRQAAWSADGSRGLLAGERATCEGIARVDRTGVHAWDLGLGSGATSFDLADFLTVSQDCARTGNADLPAWSRDGHSVAFLASPAAVGVSGPARLDASWTLYTVGESLADPAILLDGIEHPTALRWSPDGRWLALAGSVGGSEGLWLIEIATRRSVRISTFPFWLDLAWSRDGSRLVGLRDETPQGGNRAATIVIRDLSGIVETP